MNKFYFFIALASLFGAVSAYAEKGMSVSGDFLGGYSHTWGTNTPTDGAIFVDSATIKMKFGVSDKIAVHFHNVAGMTAGSAAGAAAPAGAAFNTTSAGILSPTMRLAGTRYNLVNTALYMDYFASDFVKVSFGHMAIPFGMESMWDRIDMPTYYYSSAKLAANADGFNYDLGAKAMITDVLPGTLEVGVFDGRNIADSAGATHVYTPRIVFAWNMVHKSSDWTVMPYVSALIGRWRGGPKDWGVSVGANGKMALLFANLEMIYESSNNFVPTDTNTGKRWSVYAEPGFDLGAAVISTKFDMFNDNPGGPTGTSTTDFNWSVAVGKTWPDKLQAKLAYQHSNLSGKFAPHANDIRILVGTKW